MLSENPPWVDRVLHAHWDELEAKVGKAMMPVHAREGKPVKRKPGFRGPGMQPEVDLPCGHYGCVLETSTPGVVCKVTSDESEARFVGHCIDNHIEFPPGIVGYNAIAILDAKHLNRPVAVLWRQEAFDVGRINVHPSRNPDALEESVTFSYCMSVTMCASALRQTIRTSKRPERLMSITTDPLRMSQARSWVSEQVDTTSIPDYRAVYENLRRLPQETRVAVAVSAYEFLSTMMEHENRTSKLIGEAFTHFFEHGVMLADVHGGNLGVISARTDDYPKDYKYWAITDPGHAIFLPVREW
jgi:hypothetical protein